MIPHNAGAMKHKGTKIDVVQLGIGPIGAQIVRFLFEKHSINLLGVADIDPLKLGMDIGQLAGMDLQKITVVDDHIKLLKSKTKKPALAIIATVSGFEKIKPLLLDCINAKVNVLTTCEEMVYPWVTQPALSKEIDEAAKKNGVVVFATGVNPGFLMDFLPMVTSSVCHRIEKIQVERIQDAQFRRLAFQKKIGTGLTRDEFLEKVRQGALRHVGLTESMHLLAHKLGWKLTRTEDVIEPVVATKQVFVKDTFIAKGDSLGVNQIGRGFIGQKEVIRLYFRATIGEPASKDRIIIQGVPEIEMEIKGGLNGDEATCSLIVNAIPNVLRAAPGLRTMADIEPIAYSQF